MKEALIGFGAIALGLYAYAQSVQGKGDVVGNADKGIPRMMFYGAGPASKKETTTPTTTTEPTASYTYNVDVAPKTPLLPARKVATSAITTAGAPTAPQSAPKAKKEEKKEFKAAPNSIYGKLQAKKYPLKLPQSYNKPKKETKVKNAQGQTMVIPSSVPVGYSKVYTPTGTISKSKKESTPTQKINYVPRWQDWGGFTGFRGWP